MRTQVVASTALVVLTVSSSFAADLPPFRPLPPPPMAEPWSGFYLGGNAGYSISQWDSRSVAPIFFDGSVFNPTGAPSAQGWLAGAQIGFNCLVDGSWAWGIELDAQASGIEATMNGFLAVPTATALTQASSNQWKSPWVATFRGRIGGLAGPLTLVYVTAGPAVAQVSFKSQTTLTTLPLLGGPPLVQAGSTLSGSAVRVGGAVGIGVEQKFGRSWSGKLEYLYLDFGSYNFLSGTGADTSVRLRDNVVRAGFNYTFN